MFGKISGIDCRRFLRSPHTLPLLLIFRTLSQFRSLRLSFWKRLLRWLRNTLQLGNPANGRNILRPTMLHAICCVEMLGSFGRGFKPN